MSKFKIFTHYVFHFLTAEDETNAQIADYCMKYAINFGKHVGILSSGDILVFVKGPNKEPGFTDTIYVASVPSAVETC